MIFGVVELSDGGIDEIFTCFKCGKNYVDQQPVSRWSNPALIVIENDNYKAKHEECEVDQFGELEDIIIAVPSVNFGYGAGFKEIAKKNREKFGIKEE